MKYAFRDMNNPEKGDFVSSKKTYAAASKEAKAHFGPTARIAFFKVSN